MRIARVDGVLLYVAYACSVLAFAPSQADTPQRLIQVDVSATDAQGGPVADLKANEIQLREDGKPRPLLFFQFAGSKRTMMPHAGSEFFNSPTAPPLVFLLDRWNQKQIDTLEARTALRAALQTLKSTDNVYIYSLTYQGDLAPIRPLPQADGGLRREPALSVADLVAKVDAATGDTQGFRRGDSDAAHAPKTFQALEALAGQVAEMSGRKNLIWVTNGVSELERDGAQGFDFNATTLELSDILGRAHVAIYTVQHTDSGGGANAQNAAWRLPVLTGGRWYNNDNVARALADTATDAEARYRIAYYSAVRESDQKEHKIRLDATRKGVRLLTREGFSFFWEPTPDEDEEAALRGGRRNPADASDIGLRVTMSRKEAGAMHFDIHIDPADILLERKGDFYEGHLAVTAAVYSAGFLREAFRPVPKDLKLTQAELSAAGKDGILVSLDEPGGGAQNVRVMVFDRGLQGLGTVTVPVK